MPTYTVKAPNGKTYSVNAPAGAREEDIFGFVQQQLDQEEMANLRRDQTGVFSALGQGVKRGAQQLGVTFGDLIPAMVGKSLGFDDYAKGQMEEAAATQQQINAENPALFPSYKDVQGFGQGVKFVSEVIGEQIPNLASSLIPGLGAGAVSARFALTKAGTELAEQAAKRGLAEEAAEAFVVEGMKRAAPQIAAQAGTATNAGVFLGSYALNAPEIFQNVFEETGQLEPGVAALFGVGAAALDSILPMQLAKSISGPLKTGIIANVLEKSGMDKSLVRSATAGLLKGVTTEGLTEAAQEAISISAEKFVSQNPQVFGSKEWDRLMEAGVRGAVAGGAFGTGGGAIRRMRVRAEELQKEAAEAEAQGAIEEAERLKIEAQRVLAQIPDAPESSEKAAKQFLKSEEAQLKADQTTLRNALAELTATPENLAALAISPPPIAQTVAQAQGDLEKVAAQRAPKPVAPAPAPKQPAPEKVLRQAIGELTDVPTNLADLAIGPTPLQQMVRRTQDDFDAVAAKRNPPQPPATQAAQTTQTAQTPAPAETTETAETTEATEATEEKPRGFDRESLIELGKLLGIGRTAKILRADGPLADKDLANPADAAEVRRVLEEYLNGNPAAGAAAKVEEFLKRPEFLPALNERVETDAPAQTESMTAALVQGTPTETPANEVRDDQGGATVSGANQSGVPSDSGSSEQLGSGSPPGTGGAVAGGMGEAGPAVGAPVGRKRSSRSPLADPAPEPTPEPDPAATERAAFLEEVDKNVDELLVNDLKNAFRGEDLPDNAIIPQQDYRYTEPHRRLRLPMLFAQFRDSGEMLRQAGKNTKEAAKNRADMQYILDAIGEYGPEAVTFFNRLRTLPINQQTQLISQLNKEALREWREYVTGLAKEARKDTPRRLLLPVHRGPDLNDAGKVLARSGDLAGLIDNLRASTTNRDVRRILDKIKGLNLKTKLVIGAPSFGAGSFNPDTETITLDPNNGLNEHTALHELLHAAVSNVLNNPNLPVTKDLTALYEQIKNQVGDVYGGTNLQEFAAELFSNPDFQALLKTFKAPRSGNLFQRIMQAVGEFFGFRKGESGYEQGMRLLGNAVDISADVEPSIGQVLYLSTPPSQRKAFTELDAQFGKRPSFTRKTAEEVANRWSNLSPSAQQFMYKLLRIDNINKMHGAALPALQKIVSLPEQRQGETEKRVKHVNENYVKFRKLAEKYPAAMNRMNTMAYEARLAQVDPMDKNFLNQTGLTQQQKQDYRKWRDVYESLDAPVRSMYDTIRREYDAVLTEYENILLNMVDNPSTRAKLKAEYQARKRQIAYIPFLRSGDFWVEYDDGGERAASSFESLRERQQFINRYLKGKQHKVYQYVEGASFNQSDLPPNSFVNKIMVELNKQQASDELKRTVYDAYLALFPAESLAKRAMKADNVRGMERDILKGYGDTMVKWSKKLPAAKYNPQIDKAFNELKTQGENASSDGNDGAFNAAQVVAAQAPFIHNPTYGPLVSGATSLSYFYFIAGNISSALVNLTTLPILTYPTLGAKFGFGKAAAAMTNSMQVATNFVFGGKVPPKYKALFDTLSDHAQLEHTLAREVLEGRRQKTSDFVGFKAKVMDAVSIPFAKSEVANRAATAVAAFDLARSSGMSQDAAIEYALNTTKDVNTSGLGATAPAFMQHPAGRIFFTFKSFIWNSAFVVARAFHQSFKGVDPQTRREAQKQLLGIFAMSGAFAGVKGLPFMGVVTTLSTMLNALFGDEDEPFDPDVFIRNLVGGELMYKGPINYFTDLEIANRASMANDLLFRDDPYSVDKYGYVMSAMRQAFGPAGSIVTGFGRGAELFGQGEFYRGTEAMVPTSVKNFLKSWRFYQDGVTNLKGDPIMEDITGYNLAMQVVGFSPATLSNIYEERTMKKSYETDVQKRRAQLLNKYDMARKAGDYDLMQEVREDITKFNEKRKDPKARITRDTLLRSQRAREAAEKNTINGLRFNKNLMPELRDLLDDDDD